MNAILSEKGQVTIPKAIRDDLGLVPGMVLEFKEESGCLMVKKIRSQDPISAWRGRGNLPKSGKGSVMEYLNQIRG